MTFLKTYYVYILECSDGSYYTGVTNNIERRFFEHCSGINDKCYTFNKRPLKLMWVEEFHYVNDAIAKEKQIKRWKKSKKKALIENNYDELASLSKSYQRNNE
jgi:putative endonuclease